MNAQRTLAQRMTEGRIPVSEALHYAMSLADSLRKLHDAGKAHGAVTPSSISVTATGLELIPSLGPPATVTPYTAPEVLQGQPADARSDVFSFGALVFEMLTGRRAFDGEGQTELKLALCNAAPPPSGSPAVDRLVAGCVAKTPAARWQRMQKIIMELKLLTVAARRADAAPAARGVSDTALRSEIQQLEGRLAVRLAQHEKAVGEAQVAAGETVNGLREQLAGVKAQLLAVQERPVQPAIDVDAVSQKIVTHVQETVGAVSEQLTAHVNQTVGTAMEQHAARVNEAIAAAERQHAEHVNGALAAALQQHEAKVNGNIAAAIQQHAAKVNESVAAAVQQHEAKVNYAISAAVHQHDAKVKEGVAAALQQHEAKVNETVAVAGRQNTAHMNDAIAAAAEQHAAQVNQAIAAATEQHIAQMNDAMATATQQHNALVSETVGAVNMRLAAAEQNMEEIRKHFATLQENVAGDLHDFENSLKMQGVAIESARTAMAQTDDLVERVVEALELLQSSVLDQHEAAIVN